jgi:transposase
MEAYGGAHYWARPFREHGHRVTLMAPQFVKPSVKSIKQDRVDAEAIVEAVTRPIMLFVRIEDLAQQDFQALHRVRERLVNARMALMNGIRGLLSAYWIVLPSGGHQVSQRVARDAGARTGEADCSESGGLPATL